METIEQLLDMARLPEEMRGSVLMRQLQAEETLYRQGETTSAVYIVRSGRIRVVRHAQMGQTILLYRARSSQSFAETALFSRTHNSEAIADLPTQVLIYSCDALIAALRDDSALANAFMARLAQRIGVFEKALTVRDVSPARDRVLEYLFLVTPPGKQTVALDLPFREIAAELNLAQETLYRVLALLEQEGSIRRQRRSITLLRRSA